MPQNINTEVDLEMSELLREKNIRADINGEDLKIGQFLRFSHIHRTCTIYIATFKDRS